MKKIYTSLKEHWQIILVLLLVGLGFYLRLYGWESYSQFGWDQVDNAWAAKNILVDHKILLSGMVAKGNSGIYIGPLYYYAIVIFYFFTHLDPIASILFAAITSIFSFIVVFVVARKLFSFQVALVALFVQIVSLNAIIFDRVQWPVDFIPAISLLILFFLYKVITGNEKSLIWVGLLLGIAFHIHFTAIYFPILIILCLPFVPRTKKTILYGLVGLVIALVFLIPSILTFLQNKSYGSTIFHYGSTSYHGIHLKRILQLTNDAFIQFVPYLYFNNLYGLRLLFFPLFAILYWLSNRTYKSFKVLYLFGLWFLIPWLVLSAYSGELTDYYFSSTRFLALIILSYLITYLFIQRKNIFLSFTGVLALLLYAYANFSNYISHPVDRPLGYHRANVIQAIKQGKVIQFTEGDPESYLYYIETRK